MLSDDFYFVTIRDPILSINFINLLEIISELHLKNNRNHEFFVM